MILWLFCPGYGGGSVLVPRKEKGHKITPQNPFWLHFCLSGMFFFFGRFRLAFFLYYC